MLKVRQIYFQQDQEKLIEPEYIPYYNAVCTPYFESKVIADLILSGDATDEYYAVVSYKLRYKIGAVMKDRWKNIPAIANHSDNHFTPEKFVEVLKIERPDVLSFQQHAPHDPISLANRFHPRFAVYFKKIMHEIGYEWTPEHYSNVFYCNYFAAKTEIYTDYVNHMLKPAMDVMHEMPELFANSGYPHKLPEHLAQAWGINHYPYHAFLCERMFSYYAHINKLNCLHF